MKPSQPVIVAPSGEPQPTSNGRLTVLLRQPNSGERNLLRLSCESQGGSPPPTFEWYHNGLIVNSTASKDSTVVSTESEGETSGVRVDEFASRTTRLQQHSADLVLDKEQLRTGDRLVCLISNKATLRSKKLSQQKLRAELYVVIHCKY